MSITIWWEVGELNSPYLVSQTSILSHWINFPMLAGERGFEPPTNRLTAGGSTVELLSHNGGQSWIRTNEVGDV